MSWPAHQSNPLLEMLHPLSCHHRLAPSVLQSASANAARTSVVVHGRKDGYSKARKSDRRQGSQRSRKEEGTQAEWWMDDEEISALAAPSTSMPRQQQQDQLPRGNGRSRRQQRAVDEESDDGKGWWLVPEEASLQAYAPEELQDWQVQRLERVYALGRKKFKVQELAAELGLDRSQVLHWMKEFALKPDLERNPIIAQRLAEVEEERREEQAQAAQQAKQNIRDPLPANAIGLTGQQRGTQQQQQQQQGVQQKPTGFIPFYTRKEMGMLDPKHKRLPADAVRTLEAIYTRTPFPSREIIRGLWDLHRLNREQAIGWFTARREADGITSSEQKRRPAGKGDDSDPLNSLTMSPTALREAMGPIGFNEDNLLVQLQRKGVADPSQTASSPAQGGGVLGEEEQPVAAEQPPTVVKMSKRELAMLQSSLPSPNKYKAKKRNEEMGITAEPDKMQIGSVQYVAVEEEEGARRQAWSRGWRARRAAAPARLLPLMVDQPGKSK